MPARLPFMVGELWLGGEPHEVEAVSLDVFLTVEVWDEQAQHLLYQPDRAYLSYSLDIRVNDESGEDGAPAPAIQALPVKDAYGRPGFPSLAELGTLNIDGLEDQDWDAWYGNDAPALDRNRLRFLGWNGTRLRLRWEAEYDDWNPKAHKALLFEGEAEFGPISMRVRAPEDADRFLAAAWPNQPLDAFTKEVSERRDWGADFPDEQRYLYTVRYHLKTPP